MHIYYSDVFSFPLPENHRFPGSKYALLRERIAAVLPDQSRNLILSPAAPDQDLLLVHDGEYLTKVLYGNLSPMEVRRIGFPWSQELVTRSRHSVGGTIAASRQVLQRGGFAFNIAGGTHHAFPDHGEGFCIFNDVAVAARVVQSELLAQNILILDLDVHQGNGTAAIFAGDPSVFTLSVHNRKNFPFHKEHSSLDIALPDGAGDAEYINAVKRGLSRALEGFAPDLVIYLAGADPYSGDKLGRLTVSKTGLKARDDHIFSHLLVQRIPTAVVLAGGYAQDIHDTVDIHLNTVESALRHFW